MATPTPSLPLPDRNAEARGLLSVLADVLNLADAMGVTVRGGDFRPHDGVSVHLAEADRRRARELASAVDGAPFPTHYPAGTHHPRFTTWTAKHRDVPVVVFGSYAGPAEVAS